MLTLITKPVVTKDIPCDAIKIKKPWFDIFADSLIVGGLAALAVWTGLPGSDVTKPVIIAFSSAFLLQLARYRGLDTSKKA